MEVFQNFLSILYFLVVCKTSCSQDDTVIIKVRDEIPHLRISKRLGEEQCGNIKNFNGLGSENCRKTFPWMASILINLKGQMFYCSGALIDHFHILTAASCVAKMGVEEISRLKIVLGAFDIYNPFEEGQVERSVAQIAFHKRFSATHLENNIALIKLTEPVSYSPSIAPICLPPKRNNLNANVTFGTISGRGQLLFDPSKYPRKNLVKLWKNDKCSKRYGKMEGFGFPKIKDSNICGSVESLENSICQANIGSPLMASFGNNNMEVIGIISWGANPCVFTKIEPFLGWIKKNVI